MMKVNVKSSGMLDCFRLADPSRVSVFNEVNGEMFTSLDIDELNAVLECYYSQKAGVFGVSASSMSRDIYRGACKASTPYCYADMGNVLFPESCQPWESENESFLNEEDGKYILTFQGEIAVNRFLEAEAEALA